jgi:hypothetical protein
MYEGIRQCSVFNGETKDGLGSYSHITTIFYSQLMNGLSKLVILLDMPFQLRVM